MLPSWFKPYAGPPSRKEDGAGNVFYAQLGSTNGDKATFRVYVFKVAADGTVEEVPITNPPKNHATLSESGDTLVLCGERDGVVQDWPVVGYVAKAINEAPIGEQEVATPLWEADYVSQAELDSPPGEYVRYNKLKSAVLQLRRLARARGWLG